MRIPTTTSTAKGDISNKLTMGTLLISLDMLLPKPLTLISPTAKLKSIFLGQRGSPLKAYRSTRQVLAEVEGVLAASQPSFHHSPLEDVIELLCRGRHYAWVGIYLTVGENTSHQPLGAGGDMPGELTLRETRSKVLISMKLASRELGVLSVESDQENAFGAEDRVLLEGVADALARFLSGRGKYLARKARQEATANQPESAAVQPLRSAAAADK